MTGFVHASLLLAMEELRGARASSLLLRVRTEAESAVVRAGLELRESGLSMDELAKADNGPVLSGGFNDEVQHRAYATPLSAEYLLVQANAVVGGDGPEVHLGRIHWILHPDEERTRTLAGAEYGGVLEVGEDASLTRRTDEGTGEVLCPEAVSMPVSRSRSLHEGTLETDPFPFLGILSIAEARSLLDGSAAGTRETDFGESTFDLPLSEESVVLAEGAWSGVLVVAGDLRLEGPAEVRGLVITTGDLEVDGDSRVEGVVRVGGDMRLDGRGAFVSNPCLLDEAFTEGELRQPLPIPSGSWLRPL